MIVLMEFGTLTARVQLMKTKDKDEWLVFKRVGLTADYDDVDWEYSYSRAKSKFLAQVNNLMYNDLPF